MTRGLKHIVEPSPELQAVVGRFFAATNARDVTPAMNLHADERGIARLEGIPGTHQLFPLAWRTAGD
jgi:hypothetical protein